MAIKKRISDYVRGNLFLFRLYYFLRYSLPYYIFKERYDIYVTKRKYRSVFGHEIDLNNPQTLNEKIQWLKLNVHDDFHTVCADKLAVRNYWKQFGKDSLIPLLFQTYKYQDITYENLPDVPCIVKCNTGCGYYQIIRDKNKVDINVLQKECRRWMIGNYYYRSQEWQYKNIKPCILVEKLLLDKNGHIPNDYKLHFFNGELQFIYCSVDREGANYRSIYSPEWKKLDIEWVSRENHKAIPQKSIVCPSTFPQMLKIGKVIAENFKYVRVDFYDVDGKLYYGEITLHHGSGYDTFVPELYDLYYGKKLHI